MHNARETISSGGFERDRIGVEQVVFLHRNALVGVPAALVGLAVLAAILFDLGGLGVPAALPWLGMTFGVSCFQLCQGRRWTRRPDRVRTWRRSARWFTAWALCEGALWAWASVVFVGRDAPDQQMLLLAVILGLGAGSAVAFGSYLPACLAFLLAANLPFLVAALIEGGALRDGAAAMHILWIAGIAWLARRNNTNFIEEVRLRFANHDLAEQLREERDRAEQANVAKSRFLAAASHDLRQPVHALAMLTEAFSLDGMTGANVRVLELMRRSVGALDGLFDALLDVSRLDAGVIVPLVQPFAVGPLLARLAAEHRPRAEAKGLRLVCLAGASAASGDPVLVERIVRNLLDNAVRYTERGRVVVGCRRRGAMLSVEVWDTGPGIPAAEQSRVFDEFHQLGNPERDRSKGLGLGLAIVRRLAGLMDMRLELRSQPGRGSVFRLLMPRALVPPAAVREIGPPERTPRTLVLVVDDEAGVREAVRLLLESWGHAVLAAGSGDEMLDEVARTGSRPGLILCDHRLRGGENGIEVIERLRRACGAVIPAMLVTGDTAPDRLAEAEASGLLLLHKPVAPGRLRAAVSALIRQARRSFRPARPDARGRRPASAWSRRACGRSRRRAP